MFTTTSSIQSQFDHERNHSNPKRFESTLDSAHPNQRAIIIGARAGDDGPRHPAGRVPLGQKGGSYRTVQWFLGEKSSGRRCAGNSSNSIWPGWLLVGDAAVVTKTGKETHGLGIFFFDFQHAAPGRCFFNQSLLEVETRKSYPLTAEQLMREEARESAPKAVKAGWRLFSRTTTRFQLKGNLFINVKQSTLPLGNKLCQAINTNIYQYMVGIS